MVITSCRICENKELVPVLDLGVQAITSVFPRSPDDAVARIPLELVKCGPDGCGLVQLRHSTGPELVYGTGSYGYRSGIRPFMINHLHDQVEEIAKRVELEPGDLVLDIGSNDSTLLRGYRRDDLRLVGVDPNGEQFRAEYPPEIELISDYFTKDLITSRYGRGAKVVTSIAMFYDLPSPLRFMRDIFDVLDDGGIWVSEQSYLPSMVAAGAYDNVCHEHLEYYAFRQFEWMAERVGFTIVDAEITPVYGGSIKLTMAKNPRRLPVAEHHVAAIREREAEFALDDALELFAANAARHRDALREFLADSRATGRLTLGYGASTKGNVILQYAGVTTSDLSCVGEPNEDKWGRHTPGTNIPIVSEDDARARKPDQLLVLPWIYRDDFIERERDFLAAGGKLAFPLPKLDVVSRTGSGGDISSQVSTV